ncbi:MAG TPA: Stp1/IreP family PP2C-type Ser/Thr phosphatase [Candidatus Limnocylindrales bacterium]|nr:Stp1/IreP family PP2C-type Ser/Thr phosphatase [Candidatus Limnocylindrales bacterium]
MTATSQMLSVGVRTDAGRVRDGNEDRYLVRPPLFAVADGMGGHRAGEVAAGIAIEALADHLASRLDDASGGIDGEALTAALELANRRIFERAEGDGEKRGMATTCTAALVVGHEAWLAHVGDSRAYLYRDGALRQLTEDHSIVGSMVRERILTPEAAARHPRRHVVLRALGHRDDVEVDVQEIELHDGDRLLLCTDGLNSMLESSAIAEVLGSLVAAEAAADGLVAAANAAGGEDNVTVLVVDVGPASARARPAVTPPPAAAGLLARLRGLPARLRNGAPR